MSEISAPEKSVGDCIVSYRTKLHYDGSGTCDATNMFVLHLCRAPKLYKISHHLKIGCTLSKDIFTWDGVKQTIFVIAKKNISDCDHTVCINLFDSNKDFS